MDRSSEAGAADEGLDQHHRGASRACSKLVFFVVAFLLKSVSKRNDAWLCATSMPEDVAKVKRDLRVLGARRLECFDSTAWNRYYSIINYEGSLW